MKRPFVKLAGETDGVTFVEGLLVFPLMVLAISVCIEFGYAMYQINMAAKAMELGIRRVIVSPPFTSNFSTVFAFDATKGGQKIDADSTKTSSCGAGTGSNCDSTLMAWLVGPNSVSSANNWPGLASYYPQIIDRNNPTDYDKYIRITYEQNGLGYEGRPTGPVVTVRMETVNLPINLPLLGKLLELANIKLPPLTVSATTEDLKDGP